MYRRIFALVMVAVVTACGIEPEAEVTAPAGAPPAEKPEPVVRSSPGKPTAPIRVEYVLASRPAVDQPLEIGLTISTPLPGALSLSLATRAELALAENQAALIELGEQTDGASVTFEETVTVIPKAEGRGFLLVTAAVATETGDTLRLVAVPVQVGDVPRKLAPSSLIRGEGGEAVISLPADETP